MPPSRWRMGLRVRSQSLKSPVTLKLRRRSEPDRENEAPSTPSEFHQVRPQGSITFVVGALAVQVEFERRQQG